MGEIVLLNTIVNRSDSKKFQKFFEENKVPITLNSLGKGTATDEIMDLLGIGEPEKNIYFSLLSAQKANKLLKRMIAVMRLDIPGNGIAFTVPMASIGSVATLHLIMGEQQTPDVEKRREETMQTEPKKEVIVAITNRGYVNQVMDAARGAGASGGTVIHAKGTGTDEVEQFLGITITAEKEMVFIVTDVEQRPAIMKAIMAEAGMKTKAKTVVFSMPVSSTAGIGKEPVIDEEE